MNHLLPLSCLLLGLFSAYFAGSAAKTYSIGARSTTDCPKGTPPSACAKKHLMYPFPRVGRSSSGDALIFPRSQRVIGIVKQPRIGRSDPSLLSQSAAPAVDSQRIYDADDDQPDYYNNNNNNNAHLDYQRRALTQREDYSRSLDNYLADRRSTMSPWAFFLITPNFHNSEHAVDNLMVPQHDRQMDSADED